MIKRGGITLSDEQAAIVDRVAAAGAVAPTVAAAGAGAGKTRTMVATVLHLMDKVPDVRVDDFIMITFTNKATDETRERLEEELDNLIAQADDPAEAKKWFHQKERISAAFIGTIHRFCSTILRQYGYDEQVSHETEVLIAKRHFQEALHQAMDEGLADPQTEILFDASMIEWAPYEWEKFFTNLYEYIRNNGRSVQHVAEQTLRQPHDDQKVYRDAVARMLLKIDSLYTRLKQERGGQDSHDLLHKCAQLIETHISRIGRTLKQRYKYLFIDEFQDTDRTQKRIVDALLPYLRHVLVVGDRKQAIYGWRGAVDSVLEEMAKPGEPMPLRASRRPTKILHQVQSELFDAMSDRYSFLRDPSTLSNSNHDPNDGIIPMEYLRVQGKDNDLYAHKAIEQVKRYLEQDIDRPGKGKQKVQPRDICILFRTNSQMQRYEELFSAAGIPVVTDLGGGFFSKPEIIHCYHMIQAILKYPDDPAFKLVMGTPFLPLEAPVTLHKTDFSSTQLVSWLRKYPDAKRWYDGMMAVRQSIKVDLVPQILLKIYEFTGVRELYAQKGNLRAVANLDKLVAWSRDLFDNAEALTMQSFYQRLQTAVQTGERMDEANAGGEQERPDAVTFSTVHASKGLEYPIVIIPEVHRALLTDYQTPKYFDISTPEDWGLDLNMKGVGRSNRWEDWMKIYREDFYKEEARVLYVAVTRAQHAVCFIGDNRETPNRTGSQYWSWRDEILSSLTRLQALGSNLFRFEG